MKSPFKTLKRQQLQAFLQMLQVNNIVQFCVEVYKHIHNSLRLCSVRGTSYHLDAFIVWLLDGCLTMRRVLCVLQSEGAELGRAPRGGGDLPAGVVRRRGPADAGQGQALHLPAPAAARHQGAHARQTVNAPAAHPPVICTVRDCL